MNCRSVMVRGVVTGFLMIGMLLGMMPALGSAQATDRLASKHYARGVQYFHQGRYGEAQQELDLATGYAPNDARIYFMRGMSKMRMGASYDAEADFQMGASIEVEHGRGDVGVALQRLQGSERLTIERYRREAKKLAQELAAAQKANPSSSAKAQAAVTGDDSASVNRAASTTPPATTKRRTNPVRIDSLQPDASDPFAEDTVGFLGRGENTAPRVRQALSVEGTAEGSTAENTGDDNPVGSGVSPDATASDDPFAGDDDSTAADEMQPTEPATRPAGNGKRSVLGAALRAMMRSLPGESLTRQGQRMMPPIPGVTGGPGGGMPPAAPRADEMTPADDSASPNETFTEPDPFASEGAEENADPTADQATAEEATEDDASDTDPGDPFADEQ